jgi:hypothetical protein
MFNQGLGMPVQKATESRLPTGFFAYASLPPSIPETISAAIQAINKTQTATIQSWEEL